MDMACALPSEKIIFSLRDLYNRFGYCRYKMNKFEEYDLYARNKDFLISDNVLTFTDTNGKLMALKPDVTLSIVKNTKDVSGSLQKLYYNENVYRVSKGTHSFREIPQIGLEAIGDVDEYSIYEVMKLAAESLLCTGRNCVLEISHLGILSEVMQFAEIPAQDRHRVLHCIGEKNRHEMLAILREFGISEDKKALLDELLSLSGTPEVILPRLQTMLTGIVPEGTLESFVRILNTLNSEKRKGLLRIDFSVVSDLRYYNGFVFKGFAEGIPNSILSGGQYDRMMQRLKRNSGAIGFALYLDLLEQYSEYRQEYDVDILLLYDDSVDFTEIENTARKLGQDGSSIMVQKNAPAGIRCKKKITLVEGGAMRIE